MNRNNLGVKIWILVFLYLAASFSAVEAQDLKDDEIIKVDTLLVNIPVIASDRDGRYVSGLKKENFFIIEDGVKRNVDFFADAEAPMNVAILIDTSFSTLNVLDEIADAARDFVKTLRPEDKGIIVSFDYQTTLLTDFTSDQKMLNKAINRVRIADKGGSNMQDAMYQIVTEKFAQVKGRKAIIVLTDGSVGGKIVSNQKLLNTLAEADVLVYPILFKTGASFPQSFHFLKTFKLPSGEIISADEMQKRLLTMQSNELLFMKSLGIVTGGRLYEAGSTKFKNIFQNIADELKKQYVVGFYPSNVQNKDSHRVVVEIMPKELIIRTKRFIRLQPAK